MSESETKALETVSATVEIELVTGTKDKVDSDNKPIIDPTTGDVVKEDVISKSAHTLTMEKWQSKKEHKGVKAEYWQPREIQTFSDLVKIAGQEKADEWELSAVADIFKGFSRPPQNQPNLVITADFVAQRFANSIMERRERIKSPLTLLQEELAAKYKIFVAQKNMLADKQSDTAWLAQFDALKADLKSLKQRVQDEIAKQNDAINLD